MYDYIIAGAGSAGCVLANRLTADGQTKVLLLEAGPKDRNIWLRVPAGTSRVFKPGPLNWGYFTQPESHLNDRPIYWPRGRTLGGSSSINGMVYMRGHPDDYNTWSQLGNRGWSWDDVLPYFKKSEFQERGASEAHGAVGPLAVSDLRVDDPGGRLFIESGVNAGLPLRADFNAGDQEGIGRPQATIRNGLRASTAREYLHPVMSRDNLHIETGAFVQHVDFDGRKAVGLTYRQNGALRTVRANREVILSGGTINTPQLLMLSGIGPGNHLKEMGIDVVLDAPEVGANLQDHLYVYYFAKCDPSISVNRSLVGAGAVWQALKYLFTRQGYLNLGATQASAFVRARPGATRPDLQISFRPFSADITEEGNYQIHPFAAINAACCLLRPEARGSLTLASPEPGEPPRIQANYLDSDADRITIRNGVRWIRKIFETEPLASHITEEFAPGLHVQSDEDLDAFIRANAESMYHPVGTCRMGVDDRAVVDSSLRVKHIEGLRVIDASIMPVIPSGNTNAPTIMIAEKAASLIIQGAK